ncbi:methyl-accepting chemotaxis protein [Paenibacillus sp.]|uniref:methyl-accepting chemotaxis protein n=1 Tax=Paenibacillus sp. TaxID=58172 RepID=UPI002D220D97|nr:methyl-accepting chemotaxis protein [Paenibacillus sp.]HZG83718.1 methyl-accepting chemotaxis protein [Paenibacillus sp.]
MKPLLERMKIMNLLSVKNKLIAAFAAALLIPTIVVSLISFTNARTEIEDQMVKAAEQNVNLLNTIINDYFIAKKKEISVLAATIALADVAALEGTNVVADAAVRDELATFMSIHDEVELSFVGTKTGLYVNSPDKRNAADFDPRKRPWFIKAMEHQGEAVVTAPYVSATTGSLVVTVAKVTADGSGVVAFNVNLEKLAEIAKHVTIGREGYVYILDEERKYIYHPANEGGTVAAENEEHDKLYAGDSGSFDYVLNGRDEKKMVFATNPETGWKIAGTMYEREVAAEAAPILRTTAIVLAVALTLFGAMVFWILRSILQPLRSIGVGSRHISEGDLTQQIAVESSDELGQLGRNFNEMASSLRSIIHQINDNVHQLAASAEQMSASSEQSSSAAEQVTEAIQGVAAGSDRQAQRIVETKDELSGMAEQLRLMSVNASDVSDAAARTKDTAESGNESIQTAVAKMSSIGGRVGQLAQDVNGLGERSNEIEQIVSVISGIASQTNLLALNASIEAARAGEHGSGFAVVAAEIRKLAEQSDESAKRISELVRSIGRDTRSAVATMEFVSGEVAEGVGVVDSAGRAFEEIVEAIDAVARQIEQVSSASQRTAAGAAAILGAMEEVSAISAQSSGSIQQVVASTEEQLASMQEITASTSVLTKMAEELQGMVGKFKV